ncbi:MAG TPA: serine hydrolase [Gemmatimonadaceae bacterium]
MSDVPRPRARRRMAAGFTIGALVAVMAVVATAWTVVSKPRVAPDPSPIPTAPARPRAIVAPDPVRLGQAAARASQLPRLRSLLVSWKGDVALERYYNGATRTTPANIKSASKTIVSALVGIAIARGDLRDVRQTLGELLPADARGLDTAKRAITLEDLLTMRAGLQSTSFENFGAWVSSNNWVRDALRRPMVAQRGDAGPMIYSTGNSHVLSAILTRAARVNTRAYASRYLFEPLGVRLRGWTTDPQGIPFGGNEMRLTPREMLAFGNLYLNGGATASGAQVVQRTWIDSSWVPRTQSNWSGHAYGYGWWIRSSRGYRTYFAWGYGGQFIFVIPELQAVVVATSDPETRSREGGHIDEIYAILDEEIVPALGG